MLGVTNYAGIGFEDNDIKFLKSNFKESFLQLNFYDSDNALSVDVNISEP